MSQSPLLKKFWICLLGAFIGTLGGLTLYIVARYVYVVML